MENFDWKNFTKRIIIKADIETMYRAWGTSKELEKWFLSKAKYYNENQEELPPTGYTNSGGTYSWKWYAQESEETGKVIKANGVDYLQYTFAGNCLVTVQLEELKEEVLITLTQSNIPNDDSSKVNIRLGCAFGWAFYLVNLKSILEGGIDLRNKNQISNLVNN